MCGSFVMNPNTFSAPSIGFPNMPEWTLLFRDSSGYVEIPSKSRGLMGYSESTINPWDRLPETVRGQPTRRECGQEGCGFPEFAAFADWEPGTTFLRGHSFVRRILR